MSRPLVLVVDPDDDVRHILAALIAHAGHRVVEAGSGQEGLESAMFLRPAVVVGEHPLWLDDETTLCSALRANPATAGIPFIAITSRAFPAELEHARQTHDHAFTKPPDFREVVRVVSGLMERSGHHGQPIRESARQDPTGDAT